MMEEQGKAVKLDNLPLAPPPSDAVPITKKDINCLNGKGFLLYNVLSKSECQYYVNQADNAGFDDLEHYKKEYRDNKRIIVFSHDLASLLFERIKPFLPEEVRVEKETAMALTAEYGTEGVWKLEGMNECWRFCKYSPGGLFAPHMDGCFVRNSTERSLYTFMIYLNGDFEGGATNFLKPDIELSMLNGKYVSNDENILESVVPEPGLALVFMHPHLHEGERLKSGLKYIMRSDIMYKREGAPKELSATEEEALKLFHQAQEMEHIDAMKAMEMYRKAFKLSPGLADAYHM